MNGTGCGCGREIKRAAHRAAKSVSDAVETLTDAMGM